MSSQQFPEPTCGALIFNPEGKLFLVQSHKWLGRYVMPGGHVELGETLVQALKREVLEETGMEIYDVTFLCFQEFIFEETFFKKKHFIFFDFYCKTTSPKVVLNSEAETYVWVTIPEAMHLPLEGYTKKAIEAYLAHKAASLQK